jgi:histone H2A
MAVTQQGMSVINTFVHDMMGRIMDEADRIVRINRQRTLDSRTVSTAVRFVLSGQLQTLAIVEGTKACAKYTVSFDDSVTDKRLSRSQRGGLVFPVSRVARCMRARNTAGRLGGCAPVFLAAVLEYLVAEVLECAGVAAHEARRARIIPRHIFSGMSADEELSRIVESCTIAGGGVTPLIHPALLPARRRPAATKP